MRTSGGAASGDVFASASDCIGGAAASIASGPADYWTKDVVSGQMTQQTRDYLACGGYSIANGINPPPPANMLTPPHDNSPRKPSHMTVCNGCRQEILDRFILRVYPNMEFHATCLKCVECGTSLDERCSAFVKHDRTYCREDYMKLFGTKCLKCRRLFERTEMVMRAGCHVLHVECFRCSQCDKKLTTGEEFAIRGDQIYCRADASVNPLKLGRHSPTEIIPSVMPPHHPLAPLHGGVSAGFDEDPWETSPMTSLEHTASSPLSVRSPRSDGMTTPAGVNGGVAHTSNSSSNGSSHSNGNGSGGKKKKDKQTTRVRTVLNEKQLLMLKQCYQLNQRPDAMMKEQLVELTGLNARVIRVWFQNKRCKDKKRQIQMRDYQINAEKERALNSVRMSGIGPLVAAPPSSHIDHLNMPIEITSFSQWPDMGSHPPTTAPLHLGVGTGTGPIQSPLEVQQAISGGAPHMSHSLVELSYGTPQNSYHDLSVPPRPNSHMSSPTCSE